jgi:hypothetical protein
MLARLYQRQSRPEETVRYYRRVIRLARQTNNQFEEARAPAPTWAFSTSMAATGGAAKFCAATP